MEVMHVGISDLCSAPVVLGQLCQQGVALVVLASQMRLQLGTAGGGYIASLTEQLGIGVRPVQVRSPITNHSGRA